MENARQYKGITRGSEIGSCTNTGIPSPCALGKAPIAGGQPLGPVKVETLVYRWMVNFGHSGKFTEVQDPQNHSNNQNQNDGEQFPSARPAMPVAQIPFVPACL